MNFFNITLLKWPLLILFFIFISFGTVTAQWKEKNNGIYGGEITCLTRMENYLFAGTNGAGVYRSDDNGENWEAVNHELDGTLVISFIQVIGSKLFIGNEYSGIFVSEDFGDNWQHSIDRMGERYVSGLTTNNDIIFAATFDGLYLSSDGGKSWDPLQNGPPGILRSVKWKNGRIFVAGSAGLFVSEDEGENWTEKNVGLMGTVNYLYSTTSSLFASDNYGTYRWDDQAGDWQIINDYSSVLSESDGVLYIAAKNQGIHKSLDNGNTWSPLKTDFTEEVFKSILAEGPNIYVGVSSTGIIRSTDQGELWDWSHNGISNITFHSFVNSGNLVVAGSKDIGIYKSTDLGETWMPMTSGLSSKVILDLAYFDDTFYAATAAGLFKYEDLDNAWFNVPTPSLDPYLISKMVSIGNDFYVGTSGAGLFHSGDKGATWTNINNGLSELLINDLINDDGKLYVATVNGLYVSENGGQSWKKISIFLSLSLGLDNANVNTMLIGDSYLLAGVYLNGIGYSEDGGSSWETTKLDFGTLNIQAFSTANDFILAGSLWHGIFSSVDNGLSWKPANYGLYSNDLTVEEILVVEDKVFAAIRSNGLWVADNDQVVTAVKANQSEAQIKIYPNPAHSILHVSIPDLGKDKAELMIFGIEGKLIQKIENIEGSFFLDVNGYLSGLYVINLRMGKQVVISKFMKE